MQRPHAKNKIALSTVPTIDKTRPIVARTCFSPAALASFLAPEDLMIPMIPTTIAANVATMITIPAAKEPLLVDVSIAFVIVEPMFGITSEAIPKINAVICLFFVVSMITLLKIYANTARTAEIIAFISKKVNV